MSGCPAEIVIEQARYGGYFWDICQPDANWGVWKSSAKKYSKMGDALIDAQKELIKIHKEQGYIVNNSIYF